jgi:predicted nucleic acid-binding Zn ribbon protein
MSSGDRRDLRPVSDGLDEILSRLGLPADLTMANIVEEWTAVAGEPFGSLSTPAGFVGGELAVAARDGTAATLLRYRVGELLERLDRRYGKGRITSVRITVDRSKNRP